MKNTSIITILLTVLLFVSLLVLDSCKSSDVTPSSIDPATQPTEFTEALIVTGKTKKGTMPSGKRDVTFRIEKLQPSASVTNDNSLFIPFVYAIKPSQKLKGFYLQIKGSDVYWDIPYITKPARLGAVNENPEKNGFVLDVGIPKQILNGKFEMLYQIYDDQGNVSEPARMSGTIVPSVDYCANGQTKLGQVSGQDGMTVRSFDLGDNPGWVKIKYNTYTVKDRIDIQYAGEWVRSTGPLLAKNQTPPVGQCSNVTAAQGFVGQTGEFDIYYDPKKGKRIDVYVSGCLDGGTQWIFEIMGCPEEKAILGVHSSEYADDCKNDCTHWGHAWVSLTDKGKTTYYGLWPDNHAEVTSRMLANGPGSDIRTGIENGMGNQNRYYTVDKVQLQRFQQFLGRNLTYSVFTYNCASFASDIVAETVGERLAFKAGLDYAYRPMPCALSVSIRNAKASNPTGVDNPTTVRYTNFSHSFCQ